jgi:pyruvate ferredoxin oxidoreductase alpha subunit
LFKNFKLKIENYKFPTMKQILEGSHAIALTINAIKPAVVSAYPITPQTHIVEDLAKLKADGKAKYAYIRAESEFAAASIVAGASATGARVYTATSSQGVLLMSEVIYNIAGMRLPVVMTVANRGISAPITIWNDHQDAMSVRDAGWIMLFAENHQEAVEQHILAYKVAEQLRLPVMVNVDGFVLTHTYEGVNLPDSKQIKEYLPDYAPEPGTYLDPADPKSLGTFAAPAYYMEIREKLHNDLRHSSGILKHEYENLKKIIPEIIKPSEKEAKHNDALTEYYGPKNPTTVIIALGSLIGTIKDAIDELKTKPGLKTKLGLDSVGVLKIKCYRPFPDAEVIKVISKAKYVAVLEKAVSLGASDGPLALDVKAAAKNETLAKVESFIVGLGGRDITKQMIDKALVEIRKPGDKMHFIGK